MRLPPFLVLACCSCAVSQAYAIHHDDGGHADASSTIGGDDGGAGSTGGGDDGGSGTTSTTGTGSATDADTTSTLDTSTTTTTTAPPPTDASTLPTSDSSTSDTKVTRAGFPCIHCTGTCVTITEDASCFVTCATKSFKCAFDPTISPACTCF